MFYSYVKLFFAPLVRIYLRLRVENAGRMPRQGPAILVANHASFLDPIVLGSACPRPIHFIVLQRMYDWWRLRWFYWGLGTIPVRTEESDPKAIREALGCLKRGEVLGIFPEGGRSLDGAYGPPKIGAALLAAMSGVPVVPCHIEGAFAAWRPRTRFPWPGRVRVRFGNPIRFPAGGKAARDREALERFSGLIMATIAGLGAEGSDAGEPDRGGQRAASPGLPGEP